MTEIKGVELNTFYSDSSIAADLNACKMQRAAASLCSHGGWVGVVISGFPCMPQDGHMRTIIFRQNTGKLITQHNDKSK
jgi:hypothetical protein